MPDAFTPRLNLTKPGVNESQSTWGNKWNANADALDAAMQAIDASFTSLNSTIAALQQARVPIGGIVMFSGTVAPAGWSLCNGTNGTPDLRDRFIVGTGASYALGATGGAGTVTLSEAQLPSHSHSVNDPGHGHAISDPGHVHSGTTSAAGDHAHTVDNICIVGSTGLGGGALGSGYGSRTTSTQGNHAHSLNINASTTGIGINAAGSNVSVNAAGGGAAHENRPPFYALAYIMRVS